MNSHNFQLVGGKNRLGNEGVQTQHPVHMICISFSFFPRAQTFFSFFGVLKQCSMRH
jgi:hypothetical protein